MGRLVLVLVGFGVGLIGGGLYWKLIDDSITLHIQKYILTNSYATLSQHFWDLIPWVVVILGIICLISGATVRSVTRSGGY